jgi:hypothetical protein
MIVVWVDYLLQPIRTRLRSNELLHANFGRGLSSFSGTGGRIFGPEAPREDPDLILSHLAGCPGASFLT